MLLISQKAHCQLSLVNKLLPKLPLWLYQKIAFRTASKHSLTFTSLPGPDQKVYIVGKPVASCRAAVFGHIHPIFTLLSYNQFISLTLVAGRDELPDMHLIPFMFGKALIVLARQYNVDIPLSMNHFCD